MTVRTPCTHCGKPTLRVHPILDIPLCALCQRQRPEEYQYITKTRAQDTYRVRPRHLRSLRAYMVDNPHYSKAAPMQLYLVSQIKALAREIYGSDEPYIVGLRAFNVERLTFFSEKPHKLLALTPEQFQYLIANRLADWGLDVTILGNVNRKDGGIDLVAVPRTGFPFLLAVQVKHHRSSTRRTPVRDVRDFNGVIRAANAMADVGMIVTNTAFTADAQWFVKHRAPMLRLRDQNDLCRWLKRDFRNESEYRDFLIGSPLLPMS